MESKSLAYEIAQFIIDDGTQNSTSSNWNTDFEDIEERFGVLNLREKNILLAEIRKELGKQIEVLEVEVDTNMEYPFFGVVYGTLFCQNYNSSNSDPTGWDSILLKDRWNGVDTYYHIYSAFSSISLMTHVTNQKEGQNYDKSKIPESAYLRLEKQLGITEQYKFMAEIDRDTGRIVVHNNPAFFVSSGQEQPMDYHLPINIATELFQKALAETGGDLSYSPTQFRLESAISDSIGEYLTLEEPALSEEINLTM